MKILGQTDKGMVRPQNQDSFITRAIDGDTAYVIVCDGMGGVAAGDIASALAVGAINTHLERSLKAAPAQGTVRLLIQAAVNASNVAVRGKAQSDEALAGMGTTLALAVFSGGVAYIAHIGDSRAYLIRGGQATQLTRDHSLVQQMVDRGEITPDEAAVHPERRYITKAIGIEETVEEDYQELSVRSDDALLICTDGLSNYLQPELMPKMAEKCMKAGSVAPLIDFAKEMGGRDNITAVLVYEYGPRA